MAKKYILCFALFALILAGCGKKSRLTVDTFFLTVEPGAYWVEPNGSVELTVTAGTSTRSNIDINVSWLLQTSDMGSLSSDYGNKTVFTADPSAYGTATVVAVYNQFMKTVEIGIGVKSILSDYHCAGYFGVFSSVNTHPSTSFVTVDDSAVFREGSKSVRADYSIPPGGWGGFFIQAGQDALSTETADMSAFSGGRVRFWVKTPHDLEIKIDTVPKQLSSVSPAYIDDNWHEVEISLSGLGIADFSKISPYFTITVISDGTYNNNQQISGSFYVDDVRWTMN